MPPAPPSKAKGTTWTETVHHDEISHVEWTWVAWEYRFPAIPELGFGEFVAHDLDEVRAQCLWRLDNDGDSPNTGYAYEIRPVYEDRTVVDRAAWDEKVVHTAVPILEIVHRDEVGHWE